MATASPGYVLLDTMLPEILQYCNSAPSIMVRGHSLHSAIDLCNKSLVLKQEASAFEMEEDVHTYTLKFPGNRYRAIAIEDMRIGTSNQPLVRTTEREMDGAYRNWRKTTGSKPTKYFLTDEVNTIRVWPTPSADIDEDTTTIAHVTYKRDQTEIDEHIYEKWIEVIQAGTIARMLLIIGASWYNPNLAAVFTRTWSRGIREARKTSLSGTGKYPGRVIPVVYGNAGGGTMDDLGTSWAQ
jgi:hypothetical protein